MNSKFEIIYDDEVNNHIRYIDKKYWNLIKNTISKQLSHDPDVETKNRKPLKHPPVDYMWELRFGPQSMFRVFYKIINDNSRVWIFAIGVKSKNSLYIAGEEIEL
jgi:mRNA-degrading endonuclease RelE of RelBE toxin-antitoxin system